MLCQNPAVAEFDELKIPNAVRPVAEEVIKITDEVCAKLLDAEYTALARQVVAKLARKRPSPLLSGRRATWAAGVVYALGQVNFLFDPSREPYRTADELGDAFGVAKTTMGSKAKQVRDMLKMDYITPEFVRADVADDDAAVWIVEVDGLVMDVRSLSLDIQTKAFARRLHPVHPALGRDGSRTAWILGQSGHEPEEPRASARPWPEPASGSQAGDQAGVCPGGAPRRSPTAGSTTRSRVTGGPGRYRRGMAPTRGSSWTSWIRTTRTSARSCSRHSTSIWKKRSSGMKRCRAPTASQ